jgi:hypothetical protein
VDARNGIRDVAERKAEVNHASVDRLESGRLELRFATGEVFHLGEEAVTRIA